MKIIVPILLNFMQYIYIIKSKKSGKYYIGAQKILPKESTCIIVEGLFLQK